MSTTPITIEIPKRNDAESWNAAVKDGAEKAGVELPKPGAQPGAAAVPPAPKTDPDPVVYESSITINGQEIKVQDSDPAKVIEKLNAAISAAQASAAAPATPEPPKPAFTEGELFDLGIKLQKGDVSAIETFVEKSGIVERILEKKGLNVEKLNAAVTESQDARLEAEWKDATQAFLAKHKDFPSSQQNTYMMGIMLAELGLRKKPSVESFESAFTELQKRNLVFPAAKAAAAPGSENKQDPPPPPPKTAASSTAIGSHGSRTGQEPGTQPSTTYELDIRQLKPHEYTESYNRLAAQLMAAGVKKEDLGKYIKIVQ